MDLVTDILNPGSTRVSLSSGLGNNNRPMVSVMCFQQQVAEWAVQRMTGLDGRATEEPLIVGVVIDTEDVEVIGASPQIGLKVAGQHVPGLVLCLPAALRAGARTWRPGNDIDDGINLHEASAWIDASDCLDGSNRRAHQLGLQFPPATSRVRVEDGFGPAGP